MSAWDKDVAGHYLTVRGASSANDCCEECKRAGGKKWTGTWNYKKSFGWLPSNLEEATKGAEVNCFCSNQQFPLESRMNDPKCFEPSTNWVTGNGAESCSVQRSGRAYFMDSHIFNAEITTPIRFWLPFFPSLPLLPGQCKKECDNEPRCTSYTYEKRPKASMISNVFNYLYTQPPPFRFIPGLGQCTLAGGEVGDPKNMATDRGKKSGWKKITEDPTAICRQEETEDEKNSNRGTGGGAVSGSKDAASKSASAYGNMMGKDGTISKERMKCAKLSDVFTYPIPNANAWAKLRTKDAQYHFLDSDVANIPYDSLKEFLRDKQKADKYILKGFMLKNNQLYYTQKWWEFLPTAQPDTVREHPLPTNSDLNDNENNIALANMCAKESDYDKDFGCYWKDMEPFRSASSMKHPPFDMKNICFSYNRAIQLLGKAAGDPFLHSNVPRSTTKPLMFAGDVPQAVFVHHDVSLL